MANTCKRYFLALLMFASFAACTRVGKQEKVNDSLDSLSIEPRTQQPMYPETNNSYGDSLHRNDSLGVIKNH